MSAPPTASPASQAQQPYYVCPRCEAHWSLRDVRYCYACRDCGSGLIAIPEEQSVVIPAATIESSRPKRRRATVPESSGQARDTRLAMTNTEGHEYR